VSSSMMARSTETILVIEDDRAVQRALKRLFEAEDFGVHISESGNAGLDAFRSVRPSLVVLDLRLPGLHGRTSAAKSKKKRLRYPSSF